MRFRAEHFYGSARQNLADKPDHECEHWQQEDRSRENKGIKPVEKAEMIGLAMI